jgi:multiple sugar transport system substrate-binding protein
MPGLRRRWTRPKLASAVAAAALLATACASGSPSSGGASGHINPSPFDSTSARLTLLTYPNIWAGFTKSSSSGASAISSWYTYFNQVWARYLPNVTLQESGVPNEAAETERTLLGVSAGNPPDLIAIDRQLPILVQKHALMNLDALYAAYGLTPDNFTTALAQYSRYDGHWYAMPGVNMPTSGDLMFVPQYVQAAGLDPNAPPRTFAQLLTMTKRVTEFNPDRSLKRIGFDLILPGGEGADPGFTAGSGRFENEAGLYCNQPSLLWNVKTGYNFLNPCFAQFVTYVQQVIDFYGGYNNYIKFMSGDPGPWNCAKGDYTNSGKVLYAISAFWAGTQFDRCYPTQYRFSFAPTGSGTADSLRAVQDVAWVVGIPRGAKNADLAFKFWYDTIYLNAQLAGPTTNGYARPAQESTWMANLVSSESKVRQQNHFPGNPITSYGDLLATEGNTAADLYAQSPVSAQFDEALTTAVNAVLLHQKSVGVAMQEAQSFIVGVERANGLPTG